MNPMPATAETRSAEGCDTYRWRGDCSRSSLGRIPLAALATSAAPPGRLLNLDRDDRRAAALALPRRCSVSSRESGQPNWIVFGQFSVQLQCSSLSTPFPSTRRRRRVLSTSACAHISSPPRPRSRPAPAASIHCLCSGLRTFPLALSSPVCLSNWRRLRYYIIIDLSFHWPDLFLFFPLSSSTHLPHLQSQLDFSAPRCHLNNQFMATAVT